MTEEVGAFGRIDERLDGPRKGFRICASHVDRVASGRLAQTLDVGRDHRQADGQGLGHGATKSLGCRREEKDTRVGQDAPSTRATPTWC